MTNKELQDFLKQYPDNAVVTAIMPTVTSIRTKPNGSYQFCHSIEGITPLSKSDIKYNDFDNFILIYQENKYYD